MAGKNDDLFNFINSLFGDMATASSNTAKTNSDAELNKAAWEMKRFYDSFVTAGFTPEQAMTLICTFISALVSKGGSDV